MIAFTKNTAQLLCAQLLPHRPPCPKLLISKQVSPEHSFHPQEVSILWCPCPEVGNQNIFGIFCLCPQRRTSCNHRLRQPQFNCRGGVKSCQRKGNEKKLLHQLSMKLTTFESVEASQPRRIIIIFSNCAT